MMYEVSSSEPESESSSGGGRCGPDPTAGCGGLSCSLPRGGRGALETSGARGPNSLPGLVACNPLCLVLQLQLPHI